MSSRLGGMARTRHPQLRRACWECVARFFGIEQHTQSFSKQPPRVACRVRIPAHAEAAHVARALNIVLTAQFTLTPRRPILPVMRLAIAITVNCLGYVR
jgi:hypothetical protein